ncbi:MAG: RNA-binding protein [Bacteroidales bacterium]|nr:RNA-binding protein [Bacteroidales bacterium]
MNIYVGNLHYGLSEDDLKNVFSEYGDVESVKIITDKFSGRSKGFGFVDMPNDEEAQRAIDELNDTDLKGRNMKVNQARAKTENDNRRGYNSYNR